MAFDFPSNPTQGDIWTDTASGASYSWNGFAWTRGYNEPPVGAPHPPAETIPVEPPIDGADSVDEVLRNFSADIVQLQQETGNKVDVAGDTMTGPLILSEHPTAASPEFQAATKGFVAISGLPVGGTVGQTLAISSVGVPGWGNTVDAGNFS